MTLKQIGPNVADTTPGQDQYNSQSKFSTSANFSKPPKKWVRVLAAFVRGEQLHRFSAEARHHDHTLPSTVSELQKKGVRIDRRDECVPGYRGEPAYVTLYWIDPAPDNIEKARRLLEVEGGAL